MHNRNGIDATATEDKQLVGIGDRAPCGIFYQRFMGKTFCHGAVADSKGLFPDVIPSNQLPSALLMQTDNVPREIVDAIKAGIAGGNVSAVHRTHAPRFRQTV
jgi:hypothetical protein